ncbi:MAG: J domain-containing protein [Alphaproteobacteria bacterium]|nr:J domain-containing protein [Alphaproteobacteria bacterium]
MINNADALGYYAALEVHPRADSSIIKRQYYEKAKYWHPDHNEDSRALEMFQKVSVAYDVLKDEKLRMEYDLLSCVYNEKDFPALGSLKIYKNQAGRDDKALRVLKQITVKTGNIRESKDICNIREACNMVLSTSINNWLFGWWGKSGFSVTKKAIKFNLNEVSADNYDNLKLLIHNAVAYEQENNIEMAWIYAKQAEALSANNEYIHQIIASFADKLGFQPKKTVKIPRWNSAELVRRQYLFPVFLILCLMFVMLMMFAGQGIMSFKSSEKGYYEERVLSGRLVATDMVESKIMKTDSDAMSKEYLIHLTQDCTIYNGPDVRYSPMVEGKANQTVRITGYTPDKSWYQIMLDNGEMGYIEKNKTEKGMGDQVPFGSHVYKGQ